MASTLRFDNWEDSNGTPILDGANLAIPSSATPTGSIIAVKHALFTGVQTASVASQGNVPVTDLSITHALANPSNKLIISAYLGTVAHSEGYGQTGLGLADNGSLIGIGDAAGNRTRTGVGSHIANSQNYVGLAASLSFVYEPGDTASHTYTVCAINIRWSTATVYINRTVLDNDDGNRMRSSSGFVIQEVAV